ncbi:unnamed protein product [Rotaria sordida]|uniref:Uncharacterized protein n=1 Tax=Rotaria sordida TaxID=392033 RepID=A0A819TP80_9BILA|nr:unnamed protein product [Rotaria sordida]
MASSISSSKRSLSSEEKENDQKLNNDSSNKKLKTTLDSQQEIRLKIIEEFRKRNLEIPLHLINTIDRSETSETNCNDAEHRKELYARLSEYLDRRQVGNRDQPKENNNQQILILQTNCEQLKDENNHLTCDL